MADEDQIVLFPSVEADAEAEETSQRLGSGRYRKDEVVSAWIKEMRIGNIENAFYWTRVILKDLNLGLGYILRRLAIFAFEDAYGPEPAMFVAAAIACANATRSKWRPEGDGNIPLVLVEYMCRCPKFWEVEEGRQREALFKKTREEFKNSPPREIPSYALDVHTKAGRRMRDEADCRFSGNFAGRAHMIRMFKALGKLDPNAGEIDK